MSHRISILFLELRRRIFVFSSTFFCQFREKGDSIGRSTAEVGTGGAHSVFELEIS
jgi:hypothetical protein